MSEPRVLLIEDEPGYARFLVETLRESGVPAEQVRCAGSLAEALGALQQGGFDVALLDLGLPDADGTEAVSELSQQYPGLPLVVLSGLHDLEVALESMRLGAQEYLVKGQAELALLPRAIRYAIERKRLHDAAVASRAEAERANATKDAFIAMLGHELRNPLTPISIGLTLIRRRGAQGIERELSVIERQVRLVSALVDDLLDVSRISHGKLELHREDVEVGEVVEYGLEVARSHLDERQHRLTLDLPRGLWVHADKHRLAQVFSNLLTNAAKYTPSGGAISVTAARHDDLVEVRVRDNGVGMSPELQATAFDLFAQGPRTLERTSGGLGLGLSISRSIVALHGGSLTAHSEGPGRGSELVVRLPRVAGAADGAAKVSTVATAGVGPAVAHRRVLIVDDNRDAAELLAAGVEGMGHDTRTAFDGAAALVASDAFAADVALIDIGLPGMNGYQLAEALRARHLERTPLLVAVTGYGQPNDQARAYQAGFDRFLVKPVDLDEVETLIRAVEPR
ncbi:MAG: response regulator [Archangiaceae bacterium]|nr:response regulator [Archangiaceae bacterium]